MKCHAYMSYHRGMWINEGRPRGMLSVTFRLYKKATDKFRMTLLIRFMKQSYIIHWMQLLMLTKRYHRVLFEKMKKILGPSKSPIK